MEVHHHPIVMGLHASKKKWTHYLKITVIPLLTFCCIASAQGQPLPDSILKRYNAATDQKTKGICLWKHLRTVISNDSNEVKRAAAILAYFQKQKDETGADNTQLFIADRLNRRGDYVNGLNMALSTLSKCEKRKDTIGIIYACRTIANCYAFALNFEQAITWLKTTIPIILVMNNEVEVSTTYNDLGAIYAQASMGDSGLIYAQQAVNIDLRLKNKDHLNYSLGTLAENYMANKEYELALPFLKKALGYALANTDAWPLAYTYMDLSQAYAGLKNYDSSIYYAKKCIELSISTGYKETLLKSYKILYETFEVNERQDSANKYFRLATAAKDSVYSIEKANNIQAINFRNQQQQQEKVAEKIKAETERKTNIQYAALAIGIIFFISIFLLLSRSIIVNEKWISFLGILGLLVVFEFVNLFFHPYIAGLTNHSPVLMLLVLVVIAALLIPLHHRIEHWIKHKMVEKNKKIRLEAAKKTIEELENRNS
jgi:tetratricopeptide (TPR) repeat protein